MSSVGFGTNVGRLATLYLGLPALSAYVILVGSGHLVSPVATRLGFHEVELLNPWSFLAVAALTLAMIHHEGARAIGQRVAKAIGALLVFVFLRCPQWVLTRPFMRRFLGGPWRARCSGRALCPSASPRRLSISPRSRIKG